MSQVEEGTTQAALPMPLLPPLTPDDTPLAPSDTVSQLLTYSSTWIDLASPDPVIAHISRQVFNTEIAYAAFCGVITVVVQAPKLYPGKLRSQGLSQFARAVQEVLLLGPYIQIHIMLPMSEGYEGIAGDEMGHLAPFAREEFFQDVRNSSQPVRDSFGTWDAWNVIRTVCKYNTRLSVGKNQFSGSDRKRKKTNFELYQSKLYPSIPQP